MRKLGVTLATLVLLSLAACGGGSELPAALVRDLNAAVDMHWQEVGAQGLTIAVRRGATTWVAARGLADIATARAMKPTDRLRVGSITKTFTSSVILQLLSEGKLSLDDPLDKFVSGFNFGNEVTIRRALTHSSGIFNYTDDPAFLNQIATPASPSEVVNWALGHDAPFAPGTSFGYSNTNFVLLGMVVEAVDGRPYHRAIRERTFSRAGLADTFVEGLEPTEGLVPGYILKSDPGLAYDASWAFGTGNVVSTASDLCRWLDVLYRTPLVLSPALQAQMTTETTVPDGTKTYYGMGTYLYTRGGRATFGHTGSTMGFKGEVFIEPVSGDCVAVLTNDFLAEQEKLTEHIWNVLAATP